jgi:hypothetical protein
MNRVPIMKVTIDSSESLESAIRVLGAMYDVTLTVAAEVSSPLPKSRPTDKAGPSRSPKRGGAAKSAAAAVSTKRPLRGSKTTAKSVSASELRSWARANGYDVGSYGRVPAAVATAYREAHKS